MLYHMSDAPYNREIQIVQQAIARLRTEADRSLIVELEDEQLAAATGLEWYGITKSVLERFLSSRSISDETRAALLQGVRAIQVIYGGA